MENIEHLQATFFIHIFLINSVKTKIIIQELKIIS